MSFFRRPDYRSETTEFIDQLKSARPGLEQAQRRKVHLAAAVGDQVDEAGVDRRMFAHALAGLPLAVDD